MQYLNSLIYLLFLAFISISCSHNSKDHEEKLPILGRREAVEKEINGKTLTDTIYHTIADFSFVDQDSNKVTQEIFDDKIYVADFFFTSCPTICPVMKTQMLRVYNTFKDNDEVALLSHSIDPEHDSVAVLKDFAGRLGVDAKKWHFVTGEKEDIFKIGQGSYMVTAMDDQSQPGGFLHSGAFILVDKDKRVRGIYDGTKEDQVDKLIEDISSLLKEYR